MALIADDAADRAEQLLLITERLAALIVEETRRIEAREPPLAGADADEKQRLANAYRLELARIKQEPSLINTAPPATLAQLRERTGQLQAVLDRHELALDAVRAVAEGLVQAMAEEVVRQRAGGAGYGARGHIETSTSPSPAVLDRQA
jgi:hypothetical protein